MKELKAELTKEMHGMQRVPSLLFNNPEILACEPLHDIMNHVKEFIFGITPSC